MHSCHISKRGNTQEIRGQKRGSFAKIKGQTRGKFKGAPHDLDAQCQIIEHFSNNINKSQNLAPTFFLIEIYIFFRIVFTFCRNFMSIWLTGHIA